MVAETTNRPTSGRSPPEVEVVGGHTRGALNSSLVPAQRCARSYHVAPCGPILILTWKMGKSIVLAGGW